MLSDDQLASHMREAVRLAELGRFRVEPNPPVGALVVDEAGTVVGRGHHRSWGGPHAEVHALSDAGERARGGTLIVTLEPCAHTRPKKTPRCVDAVLHSGVAHVVTGSADPDGATRGRAATLLRDAGVTYTEGVLAARCDALIEHYAAHRGGGVPWVISKWAMSADGRIADDARRARWISGPAARELVHEVRATVDAIVVGRATVDADDPSLDCRIEGRPSPLRVVVDSQLRLPRSARVVRTARRIPTLVVCTDSASEQARRDLEGLGVQVAVGRSDPVGRVDPHSALRLLAARGARRVLLEPGGTLHRAWLRAGCVHQVMAFIAPVFLGGSAAPTPFTGSGWPIEDAPRLLHARASAVGEDAMLEGYFPGNLSG